MPLKRILFILYILSKKIPIRSPHHKILRRAKNIRFNMKIYSPIREEIQSLSTDPNIDKNEH